MSGDGNASGVGGIQAGDPEVVVLVVQHQHPIPPQQGARVAAVGAGVDHAAPHLQPHQPALAAAAAEPHLAGLTDQVLLAHEAVLRPAAQPLPQQESQRSKGGVQGGRGWEGPEPRDALLWFRSRCRDSDERQAGRRFQEKLSR